MSNDLLQLWNSFSYHHSVNHFSFLLGQRAKYFGKDKKLYSGEYLFTVDWCHPDANLLDTDHSEIPQEHKCAHVLELDNGNFAAQPNNRYYGTLIRSLRETKSPTTKSNQTNGM